MGIMLASRRNGARRSQEYYMEHSRSLIIIIIIVVVVKKCSDLFVLPQRWQRRGQGNRNEALASLS